jgi:hypothetical protein
VGTVCKDNGLGEQESWLAVSLLRSKIQETGVLDVHKDTVVKLSPMLPC